MNALGRVGVVDLMTEQRGLKRWTAGLASCLASEDDGLCLAVAALCSPIEPRPRARQCSEAATSIGSYSLLGW